MHIRLLDERLLDHRSTGEPLTHGCHELIGHPDTPAPSMAERMLVCMRTSMNLPDGLLEEAKARAATEGTTVTRLVIEGLRARLSPRGLEETSIVVLPTADLGPATAHLSDNAAVRDALDEDADSLDHP